MGKPPPSPKLYQFFQFNNSSLATTTTIETDNQARKNLGRKYGTIVHIIASKNFLETFSVENGISETVLALATAGGSVASIPERVSQMLRGEVAYIANNIRTQGYSITRNEVYKLMKNRGGMDKTGKLKFYFRFVNYPKKKKVCFAKGTKCLRTIHIDRLGYEILVMR
jgi:hypothetical protein